MNGFRPDSTWNKSVCNPYNMRNNTACEIPYIIVTTERPFISWVNNPLGDNPFIRVNTTRTNFDFMRFHIVELDKDLPDYFEEYEFDCINYQNYIPFGIIKNGYTYHITCRTHNSAGVSLDSNIYLLDLWFPGRHDSQDIICGDYIYCDPDKPYINC